MRDTSLAVKGTNLRGLLSTALLAALVSVMGYISFPLPFSPVPVTAQTLAVMLAGAILPPRLAALSIGIFLLLGIAGLPVFSGGKAGLGVLIGPTGGYLVGFLAGAVIISLLKRGGETSALRLGAAVIAGGVLTVYLIGVPWLGFVTGLGWTKAATVGTLPYIPGDIFKVVVATLVGIRVNRYLLRF